MSTSLTSTQFCALMQALWNLDSTINHLQTFLCRFYNFTKPGPRTELTRRSGLWHRTLCVCFLNWQAMLMKAGRLIWQKVFLVNIAWIHTVHVLVCCPTNMILVWLGGVCHGKDNCLHVFVILLSAAGVVIRFPLSTNSSSMRHIVLCWQQLCSQRGNFCPQGECNYAADHSPSSHRDEANEEEETG